MNDIDNTYINGLKYINIIAVSSNIMSYIKECVLCERNKILDTDYRGYIVDINFNEYFDKDFSI